MKKVIGVLIVLIIIWYFSNNTNEEITPQENEEATTEMQIELEYSADLLDVTEGAVVRGLTTNNTSGLAKAGFVDNQYVLEATFTNLPEALNDDFYEGWVVRKGEAFDVVSTGEVTLVDGVYTNNYTSDTDLTDHDFYVLTIEPNDGDPAPADHILSGTLGK